MKDLRMPENLIQQLTKLIDSVSPPVLADLLVSVIETSFDEKLTMLSTINLKERVEKASEYMTRQLHVQYSF
jgi:ATP-dependent Lon protease